jgi:hypothetical protein
MKTVAKQSLRIAEAGKKKSVSRARKQFNTLIKQLEGARARLAAWEDAMPAIRAQAEREFEPLAQAYSAHQRNVVLLLDQMYAHKALSQRERTKLDDLICALALEFLVDGDDVELKDIYNRHSGGDFDAESAEEGAALREMLETLTGMPVDADLDLRSPEAVLEALAAQMGRHADQQEQAAQTRTGQRPKPAAALARERRQAEEADRLKQSVRDIFRKLASALHPDRETDAAERTRKTALMQRVNVAYAADDLLGLLELQLEVEQINQASLDSLSEERIRQYNKILTGQLSEIEHETAMVEHVAAMEAGLEVRGRLTPQVVLRRLRADVVEMQAKLDAIPAQLDKFGNVSKLKIWLKNYRPAPACGDDDAYWF